MWINHQKGRADHHKYRPHGILGNIRLKVWTMEGKSNLVCCSSMKSSSSSLASCNVYISLSPVGMVPNISNGCMGSLKRRRFLWEWCRWVEMKVGFLIRDFYVFETEVQTMMDLIGRQWKIWVRISLGKKSPSLLIVWHCCLA